MLSRIQFTAKMQQENLEPVPGPNAFMHQFTRLGIHYAAAEKGEVSFPFMQEFGIGTTQVKALVEDGDVIRKGNHFEITEALADRIIAAFRQAILLAKAPPSPLPPPDPKIEADDALLKILGPEAYAALKGGAGLENLHRDSKPKRDRD